MKNSVMLTVILLTGFTLTICLTLLRKISAYIEGNKEYELARRRVEEQLTAFQKDELAVIERERTNKIVLIGTDTDDWNVEKEYGISA